MQARGPCQQQAHAVIDRCHQTWQACMPAQHATSCLILRKVQMMIGRTVEVLLSQAFQHHGGMQDSMEARLKLDSSRSTDQAGGSSCWPVPGVKSTIVDEQAMLLPSLAVVVEITGPLAAVLGADAVSRHASMLGMQVLHDCGMCI